MVLGNHAIWKFSGFSGFKPIDGEYIFQIKTQSMVLIGGNLLVCPGKPGHMKVQWIQWFQTLKMTLATFVALAILVTFVSIQDAKLRVKLHVRFESES